MLLCDVLPTALGDDKVVDATCEAWAPLDVKADDLGVVRDEEEVDGDPPADSIEAANKEGEHASVVDKMFDIAADCVGKVRFKKKNLILFLNLNLDI